MEETMTVRQVLESTINTLGQIRVPISLSEEIAEPIKGCIMNIRLCLEAMMNADKELQEKEKEENEHIEDE